MAAPAANVDESLWWPSQAELMERLAAVDDAELAASMEIRRGQPLEPLDAVLSRHLPSLLSSTLIFQPYSSSSSSSAASLLSSSSCLQFGHRSIAIDPTSKELAEEAGKFLDLHPIQAYLLLHRLHPQADDSSGRTSNKNGRDDDDDQVSDPSSFSPDASLLRQQLRVMPPSKALQDPSVLLLLQKLYFSERQHLLSATAALLSLHYEFSQREEEETNADVSSSRDMNAAQSSASAASASERLREDQRALKGAAEKLQAGGLQKALLAALRKTGSRGVAVFHNRLHSDLFASLSALESLLLLRCLLLLPLALPSLQQPELLLEMLAIVKALASDSPAAAAPSFSLSRFIISEETQSLVSQSRRSAALAAAAALGIGSALREMAAEGGGGVGREAKGRRPRSLLSDWSAAQVNKADALLSSLLNEEASRSFPGLSVLFLLWAAFSRLCGCQQQHEALDPKLIVAFQAVDSSQFASAAVSLGAIEEMKHLLAGSSSSSSSSSDGVGGRMGGGDYSEIPLSPLTSLLSSLLLSFLAAFDVPSQPPTNDVSDLSSSSPRQLLLEVASLTLQQDEQICNQFWDSSFVIFQPLRVLLSSFTDEFPYSSVPPLVGFFRGSANGTWPSECVFRFLNRSWPLTTIIQLPPGTPSIPSSSWPPLPSSSLTLTLTSPLPLPLSPGLHIPPGTTGTILRTLEGSNEALVRWQCDFNALRLLLLRLSAICSSSSMAPSLTEAEEAAAVSSLLLQIASSSQLVQDSLLGFIIFESNQQDSLSNHNSATFADDDMRRSLFSPSSSSSSAAEAAALPSGSTLSGDAPRLVAAALNSLLTSLLSSASSSLSSSSSSSSSPWNHVASAAASLLSLLAVLAKRNPCLVLRSLCSTQINAAAAGGRSLSRNRIDLESIAQFEQFHGSYPVTCSLLDLTASLLSKGASAPPLHSLLLSTLHCLLPQHSQWPFASPHDKCLLTEKIFAVLSSALPSAVADESSSKQPSGIDAQSVAAAAAVGVGNEPWAGGRLESGRSSQSSSSSKRLMMDGSDQEERSSTDSIGSLLLSSLLDDEGVAAGIVRAAVTDAKQLTALSSHPSLLASLQSCMKSALSLAHRAIRIRQRQLVETRPELAPEQYKISSLEAMFLSLPTNSAGSIISHQQHPVLSLLLSLATQSPAVSLQVESLHLLRLLLPSAQQASPHAIDFASFALTAAPKQDFPPSFSRLLSPLSAQYHPALFDAALRLMNAAAMQSQDAFLHLLLRPSQFTGGIPTSAAASEKENSNPNSAAALLSPSVAVKESRAAAAVGGGERTSQVVEALLSFVSDSERWIKESPSSLSLVLSFLASIWHSLSIPHLHLMRCFPSPSSFWTPLLSLLSPSPSLPSSSLATPHPSTSPSPSHLQQLHCQASVLRIVASELFLRLQLYQDKDQLASAMPPLLSLSSHDKTDPTTPVSQLPPLAPTLGASGSPLSPPLPLGGGKEAFLQRLDAVADARGQADEVEKDGAAAALVAWSSSQGGDKLCSLLQLLLAPPAAESDSNNTNKQQSVLLLLLLALMRAAIRNEIQSSDLIFSQKLKKLSTQVLSLSPVKEALQAYASLFGFGSSAERLDFFLFELFSQLHSHHSTGSPFPAGPIQEALGCLLMLPLDSLLRSLWSHAVAADDCQANFLPSPAGEERGGSSYLLLRMLGIREEEEEEEAAMEVDADQAGIGLMKKHEVIHALKMIKAQEAEEACSETKLEALEALSELVFVISSVKRSSSPLAKLLHIEPLIKTTLSGIKSSVNLASSSSSSPSPHLLSSRITDSLPSQLRLLLTLVTAACKSTTAVAPTTAVRLSPLSVPATSSTTSMAPLLRDVFSDGLVPALHLYAAKISSGPTAASVEDGAISFILSTMLLLLIDEEGRQRTQADQSSKSVEPLLSSTSSMEDDVGMRQFYSAALSALCRLAQRREHLELVLSCMLPLVRTFLSSSSWFPIISSTLPVHQLLPLLHDSSNFSETNQLRQGLLTLLLLVALSTAGSDLLMSANVLWHFEIARQAPVSASIEDKLERDARTTRAFSVVLSPVLPKGTGRSENWGTLFLVVAAMLRSSKGIATATVGRCLSFVSSQLPRILLMLTSPQHFPSNSFPVSMSLGAEPHVLTGIQQLEETNKACVLLLEALRWQPVWSGMEPTLISQLSHCCCELLAYIAKEGLAKYFVSCTTPLSCYPCTPEEKELHQQPAFVPSSQGWLAIAARGAEKDKHKSQAQKASPSSPQGATPAVAGASPLPLRRSGSKSSSQKVASSRMESTRTPPSAASSPSWSAIRSAGRRGSGLGSILFTHTAFTDTVAAGVYSLAKLLLQILVTLLTSCVSASDGSGAVSLPQLLPPEVLHGLEDQAIAVLTEVSGHAGKHPSSDVRTRDFCVTLMNIIEAACLLEHALIQCWGPSLRPSVLRIEDVQNSLARMQQGFESYKEFDDHITAISEISAILHNTL